MPLFHFIPALFHQKIPNRKQGVVLNDQYSSQAKVDSGVPKTQFFDLYYF